MQLPRLAVADFDDGHAEASEDLEVGSRVAAHVGDAAHQKHRDADAALHQRPGDDKPVAAVVAVAAQHRHLPLEQLAVHGFHRGHDLAAGVFHEHERRDADLVDRPPIGFAHLCGVQDAHRETDTSLRATAVARRAVVRSPDSEASMAATVNVNGRVFDQEHAVISVFDHGFLYGEGVYETWRTYNGQPFLFDRHMRRLRNSSGMIALAVPLTDEQLDARCRETIRAAGLGREPDSEAYVRMLVTRGIGELSYDPTGCPSPSIVVIVKPHVAPPPERVRARRQGGARADHPQSPGHGEPADQVEQPAEQRPGHAGGVSARRVRRRDAELPRRAGRVHDVEPVHRQGRRGVDAAARRRPAARHHPRIRARNRRRAAGIPVREAVLHDADLFGADEAFLTSSTRELVPIVQVDDRRIGNGAPGPVTRALLESFRARAQELTRALAGRV